MASTVSSRATKCICSGPVSGWTDAVCSYLSLKPGSSRCQGLRRNILIDVDCLSVLSEIVESGKPPRAMTLKGTFTCVFPVQC